MTPPKVAVLTNKGSMFGKKVLNEMRLRGDLADSVLVVDQPFSCYRKLFSYVRKKVGLIEALYFSAKRSWDSWRAHEPRLWGDIPFVTDYKELCDSVHVTRGTNSQETLKALERIAPDILVLAQTGIVKRTVLEIPRLGTLNAHPGILPYYRGIDCAKWAILNGEFDRVGVTVHWVDAGVDTGSIIRTRKYEFQGYETVEELDSRLDDLAVRTLIDVVCMIRDGALPDGESQCRSTGRQCYKMPLACEASSRRKLAEFLTRRTGDQGGAATANRMNHKAEIGPLVKSLRD